MSFTGSLSAFPLTFLSGDFEFERPFCFSCFRDRSIFGRFLTPAVLRCVPSFLSIFVVGPFSGPARLEGDLEVLLSGLCLLVGELDGDRLEIFLVGDCGFFLKKVEE